MRAPISGNAIVGQSGGPTAAINSTLAGVIKGLYKCGYVKTVFGSKNGISGVLNNNVVRINDYIKTEEDFFALECTPAAALGSCRMKLPPIEETEMYVKIFDFFKANDIRYFFYIGGNDSMDTVAKLSAYAKTVDYEIYIIGVPKTIDNDLEITDHTPGFGSAAKFVATMTEEIARDCSVYNTQAVTIVEVMGRDAGWLTAAAAIPRLYGQICADRIYLPEVVFDYDEFINDLKGLLNEKPNVVIAVSEGIIDKDGRYVGEGTQSGAVDNFGHKYLAGTAKMLESIVRDRIGCKVRAVELSLTQRCAGHCLSKCDIDEGVLIGSKAAEFALQGKTGEFVIFKRAEGEKYSVTIDCVDVALVANKIKKIDKKYINEANNNVTDELLKIIAPLIEGEVKCPMINGIPKHFCF